MFFWYIIVLSCLVCDAFVPIHKEDKGHDNKTLFTTIQSTRKALKKVRKWKAAHKIEMELAKCVSKYFKHSIPFLGRSDDEFDYEYVPEVDSSEAYNYLETGRTRHDQLELNYGKRLGNGLTWEMRREEKQKVRERRRNKLPYLSESDSDFESTAQQTDTAIDTTWLTQIWDAVAPLWHLISHIIYYPIVEPLYKHKLFTCGKDYVVSKFWAWVDAAPE